MMKCIATLLFLVLQLALVSNANAYGNHEYGLFCDTCSTQSDFETFAVANTPKRTGVSVTNVANYNTNEIYVVTMEWERENQVWYHFVTDVTPGSQALVDGFVASKGLFTGNVYMVPAPTGSGYEPFASWSGSETAAVSTAIAGTTAVAQAALGNAFWNSFAARFFGYPVAVFVFQNGDSAQYKIVAPGQVGLCCQYIEGSAKDVDDQPLDAPAVNPAGVHIGFSGESSPGLSDYQYQSHNWRYRCTFWVDSNNNVVGFDGCVQIF